MPGYVVFLRAVNVGKRQLKMADARAVKGETSRFVSFCTTAPSAAATTELHAQEVEHERATVIGKDVLMEFGVPFNEAKLTGARVEKILGVPGTARNINVVRALAQKWGA